MAATNFTPIQLYYSTTASAVPVNTNLVSGELALNIQDEKLYFKNAAGTVKLLASNATSAPVLSFQTSLSGLTPSTATTGAITLAGTLGVANGGTGQTTATAAFDALAPTTTAGDTMYFNGTDVVRLGIGTAGQALVVNSGATAPEWGSGGVSTGKAIAMAMIFG
jgi:hypothetical protein